MTRDILDSDMVELGVADAAALSDARRLSRHYPLEADELKLINRLAGSSQSFAPGQMLSRRGLRQDLLLIQSGWAIRTRDLPDGRRQIYSFLLPGDVVSFRGASRGWSNTTVTALTAVKAIDLTSSCDLNSGAGLALACVRSIEQERQFVFDQVARLGQSDAYQRLIDLLSELCGRLDAAGLKAGDLAVLPITQDIFSEALGVTAVHVRRLLQRMKTAGVLQQRRSLGLCLDAGALSEERKKVCG
ncbi:MAG: hypothetical protein BGN86_10480 [Caulobacterales bacterium 68-7]|nr:MAG: hypothetical protein BGN86_10480 [Caulobacterales bacterium 68-7]